MSPHGECPRCGRELNAATPVHGLGTPVAGDLSVCAYCGAFLEFARDGSHRELSASAFAQLPTGVRAELERVRRTVQSFNRSER